MTWNVNKYIYVLHIAPNNSYTIPMTKYKTAAVTG